jgi:hypothetical protein
MGGVVQTPRRAGNPTAGADASLTVDVGCRRGGRRPLLSRAPVHRGSPHARSGPFELAGLPGGWRAAIARRVGWATRSKRSSTRRTSAVSLSQRARRARSDTTLSTSSYCRATSATHRTTHVASVVRRSPHAGSARYLRSVSQTAVSGSIPGSACLGRQCFWKSGPRESGFALGGVTAIISGIG